MLARGNGHSTLGPRLLRSITAGLLGKARRDPHEPGAPTQTWRGTFPFWHRHDSVLLGHHPAPYCGLSHAHASLHGYLAFSPLGLRNTPARGAFMPRQGHTTTTAWAQCL